MFNSVILDVAIGVVFIFLTYSLLATSIQEAIATGLSLRARNLKDGIVNGMLSDTPNDPRWLSFFKGIWSKGVWSFLLSLFYIFVPRPKPKCKNLGHHFYEHPIIKNYGSSRFYPHPSYLPTSNFSSILVDVLKKDFTFKINDIANKKAMMQPNLTQNQIKQNLQNSPDVVKLKELLSYYDNIIYRQSKGVDKESQANGGVIIDKDTLRILQMHLRNSLYNIDDFNKTLESWFDDTMNRISGWYKRQVQVILFLIGFSFAVIFNVDIIQIEGKLSTDKDARDQLVQLAVKQAATDKANPPGAPANATQNTNHLEEAKKLINDNAIKANTLMGLGWGDYGRKQDSAKIVSDYFKSNSDSSHILFNQIADIKKLALSQITPLNTIVKQTKNLSALEAKKINETNSAKAQKIQQQAMAEANKIRKKIVDSEFGAGDKISFVWHKLRNWEKVLGMLITAFAVSLGAPFWFDSLSKLISLRGTGAKEGSSGNKPANNASAAQTQPVTVNVAQQPGKEAVG
ncbi:hypothetical protein [Mucilaginibacter gotjawali]|uniref:Uncharacterized protein n=2 Tax=Mucilaginibacter gotjawali TaxID=1550579 RepID=A0A839SAR9_9SPHI|nr:hypothetical protein [Mucilaginibacter gotjawali]MBB3053749.1 hypothetical protein [Mucilaginibacter gotjawali]BAU54009.1 hypothetical protein MgSA37_02180 [Mucilaginibacter gotjawali]